jgi:hypothetical protein
MWVRSIVKGSVPRDGLVLDACHTPTSDLPPSWQVGRDSTHTIRCRPVAVNPGAVGMDGSIRIPAPIHHSSQPWPQHAWSTHTTTTYSMRHSFPDVPVCGSDCAA